MKKQSAEDYLEDFLNSVGEEKDVDTIEGTKSKMHSRRVTKSEEDFLKEFEAELEGDNFEDILSGFEEDFSDVGETPVKKEEPLKAENEEAEIEPEPSAMESFNLGGVDLGALLNETTGSLSQEEVPLYEEKMSEDPIDVFSMFENSEDVVLEAKSSDEPPIEDVFASLFGEDAVDEMPDLSNIGSQSSDSSEGLDLGNLGEADLMSLLAGDGDLSDLGDMLSQSESSEVPIDGLDAFAAFAENEMAAQSEEVSEEKEKKEKKKKKKKKKAEQGKGGFWNKIKEFLLSDDDEDEDEVELKRSKGPSSEILSDENADILVQLEAEEKGDKGKKEKGALFGKNKKDKKSKKEGAEKKEKKEKKPKKQKAPKEKKPKVPKEKKPKKPKEVDNTPPLPRGPVILIWIMVISLFAFIFIVTNLTGYSTAVSEAKSLYNTGNYAEAYTKLAGITLKEKDMEIYNQVATLATADSELNAYEVFVEYEKYVEALDSLICAAGRCELNEDSADVYGCLGQMEILKKKVDNELSKYDMTYEQALEMYHMKDREDYTIALYTKLKELGLN